MQSIKFLAAHPMYVTGLYANIYIENFTSRVCTFHLLTPVRVVYLILAKL